MGRKEARMKRVQKKNTAATTKATPTPTGTQKHSQRREMRLRKRKASPLQRLAECKQYACAFDKLYVLCCAASQQ